MPNKNSGTIHEWSEFAKIAEDFCDSRNLAEVNEEIDMLFVGFLESEKPNDVLSVANAYNLKKKLDTLFAELYKVAKHE